MPFASIQRMNSGPVGYRVKVKKHPAQGPRPMAPGQRASLARKETLSPMSASPPSMPSAIASETPGAAEAAVEAISDSAAQEVTFSLELSKDKKALRDWVHGFDAGVVRPAAHEYDEREETPWPIIQEAAKIGL